MTLTLFVFATAYAVNDSGPALLFAKEFKDELSSSKGLPPEPEEVTEQKQASSRLETTFRAGTANYKERESTIRSEWDAFYAELGVSFFKDTPGDIEYALGASFGQSVAQNEDWDIDDVLYQTNDMDFFRFNVTGSIGKILYSDRYENLRVVPFLGAGFRLIDFRRSDFNILNIITIRDTVSEKYYLPHIDAGVRFESKLGENWGISGMAAFGYVPYNQADNSSLGTVTGIGGYLVNGDINLDYHINDAWVLALGVFSDYQDLKGGSKDNVIWPDNKLFIYGGNLTLRYNF